MSKPTYMKSLSILKRCQFYNKDTRRKCLDRLRLKIRTLLHAWTIQNGLKLVGYQRMELIYRGTIPLSSKWDLETRNYDWQVPNLDGNEGILCSTRSIGKQDDRLCWILCLWKEGRYWDLLASKTKRNQIWWMKIVSWK